MLEFLFELLSNWLVILSTYIVILVGLPGGYVLFFVILFAGLIVIVMVGGPIIIITCVIGGVVYYLGNPVLRASRWSIQQVCWVFYLWAQWVNRYWSWMFFPVITTVLWWIPGVIIVPITGAIFATIWHVNSIAGFAYGILVYDMLLLIALYIGEQYENQRQVDLALRRFA